MQQTEVLQLNPTIGNLKQEQVTSIMGSIQLHIQLTAGDKKLTKHLRSIT